MMRRNLLNRTMFVMACVMGLVTTSQSLVIEHPSLQNLSTITTYAGVSEDDVPSLKDVEERHLLKMNEEELTRKTTDHGNQESLFRSFGTDSRVRITKVFHRMPRDAFNPFSLPATCTVSEEELNGLIQVLKHLANNDTSTSSTQPANDNIPSGGCPHVTEIQNLVLGVKRSYIQLYNAQRSDTDYEARKAKYESDIKKLNRTIDEISRHATQDKALIVSQMNEEFQRQKNKMNKALHDLELERILHKETKVRLVISEIKSGRVEEALREFIDLGDDMLLARIVKDTYANDIKQADNILWFGSSLPNFLQRIISYTALFEEMKKNHYLKTPHSILLDYHVKKLMESDDYKDTAEEIKNKIILLKGALLEPVQDIIDIVLAGTTEVAGGHTFTERVTAFAEQKIPSSDTFYFQHIVHLLYANGNDNTVTILLFVRGFSEFIRQLAIGYEAVYKEMHKHGHWSKDGGALFHLGVKTKYAMELPNYSKIDQKYKNIFESLKSNLPATVKQILWNDKFCIKNKHYREYLYIATNWHSHGLFTWGGGAKAGEQGEWKFQSSNVSNIFALYNLYYETYLLHNDDGDAFLTPLHERKLYGNSYWELQLVDNHRNIVIKRKSHSEYLCATSDDRDWRRRIKVQHDSVPYYSGCIWEVVYGA